MKIEIDVCNARPEVDLKTAAFTCRGKKPTFGKFTKEDWIKWLIAEHTPIETVQIKIVADEMDKSVVAQMVRHTDKHPRHFVQSSRPDLNGGKPRDPKALVRYTSYWNPQALILMMRKRLCYSAENKTREFAMAVKWQMMQSENVLLQAVGEVCVPNCVYRFGCPEPWTKCQAYKSVCMCRGIYYRYQDYNSGFIMLKNQEEKK